MSYVLFVRLRAQEGSEERAAAVVRELAAASNNEPGCEAYVPCIDPDDPRSIVIYEQYVDKDAWQSHSETEHFQRLGAGELFPLMESRERAVYETL
jgi:quinol monooxygenase YgiN